MNPKEFLRRWIEGIKNITPVQQLKSRCIGTIGCIAGLILILIVMIMRRVWYVIVLMFFLLFLQVIQYLGTRQQYLAMKEIQEEVKPIEKEIKKEESFNQKETDEILGNSN